MIRKVSNMRKNILTREMSNIGRFTLPAAVGEPFRHYPPGSKDASDLAAVCKTMRGQTVEIPCVVNGKEYFTGNTFDQVMPSDHGVVLAKVHQATPDIIKDAIAVSNSARAEWAAMPIEHRLMIFRKAADQLADKYRMDILASTMLGQGKTTWQAEIDASVETIDFLRINSQYVQEIYDVQPPLNSPNTWNRLEYRELEGFVLAISPFNFTAIGANLCTAPAIMGNTVLWKPASTAVLSNYIFYNIMRSCGLPDGVISFLPGKGAIIGSAVNDKDFGGLHFTGSTGTFNNLWKQIADNLDTYKSYPRIVGETGGKNFHMVHPSADMEHTVFNTVRGAFEYQGQKCSATSRLYAPKSMWDSGMRDLLVYTTNGLAIGQSDDPSTFVSAVIDKAAFRDHTGYIDGATTTHDCEIIAGGTYDDSQGYFIHPTVILTTDPHTKTMREEIFGPVLTVFVYDDSKPGAWEEICHVADKTSPFGLTGSIFANDRKAIVKACDILKHACGNLYINDKCTGAVVGEQPFGGARASGTNDKAGSHLNLLRWVQAKTIKETTTTLTGYKYPYLLEK